MKNFDAKVFAVPCDAKGRPDGQPKVQPRLRVAAADTDAAKAKLRTKLSAGHGRVISINVTGPKGLVAYVEESR